MIVEQGDRLTRCPNVSNRRLPKCDEFRPQFFGNNFAGRRRIKPVEKQRGFRDDALVIKRRHEIRRGRGLKICDQIDRRAVTFPFAAARRVTPGGVDSPARASGSVGGTPRFIERGAGASFWDVDGNRYLDYVLSWGPLAVGHAHPAVVEVIKQTAARGTSYVDPTATATQLAELVVATFPSVQLARLVHTGHEATITAVHPHHALPRSPPPTTVPAHAIIVPYHGRIL